MSTNSTMKTGLIVWILAMSLVAGCSQQKNKGSDRNEEPIEQYGALSPESVEATSLLEGPWCLDQVQGRKKYQLRAFFKESGEVVIKSYKMLQGVRQNQVGDVSTDKWILKGDALTYVGTEGAKTVSNLNFKMVGGDREMTIETDGYEDQYYGCP